MRSAASNLAVGITGIVISIALIASGSIQLSSPRKDIDLKATQAIKMKECKDAIIKQGFDVKPIEYGLRVLSEGIEEYELKLVKSSLIAARCESFEINNYCMGDCSSEIKQPFTGVVMELQYVDPDLK